MAEITINTIVKIIIILTVIILVVVSFFILWQNFLKPYFEGLGSEVGAVSLLALKNLKRKF